MSPKRIQRRRTKGWRLHANTVIVDRTSRFGNPFRVGIEARDNAHAKLMFRQWVKFGYGPYASEALEPRRTRILADMHLLRGKDLACTCGLDEDCHGDVLLEVANHGAW